MKLALSRKNIWERLPRPVKSGVGSLLGMVPPQYLLGRRFRDNLCFVQEAQWWPAERSRQYQLEQLRRICTLAYERTPYYRRAFDAVGFLPGELKSVDDLVRLPTINKDTLREHLDEMCAVSPAARDVDYVSTGGTGGEPLRFYIGAERSAIEYAYLVASWQRVGYRLGMPLAVFRGRVVPPDRTGLRHEYDSLLRHHYYCNFHMTDENMRRYLEHLRGIGRCFLHAYPSSVAALARFLRAAGARPPQNICGIIVESENVYLDQRRAVEDIFERRVFSSYGHSEKLMSAAECEHSSEYHVWPTYGYFELLDEDRRPVTTSGQTGEIVGTGFINTVLPFIRYRTGDYATYVGEGCPACGREHTLIGSVQGRWPAGDFVSHDGSLISMTALNVHDDTFDHVRQFQFYQDTPGRALLRIVPATGFSSDNERRIRASLSRKLDGRLEFDIQCVDTIPLSPRGKAIYVDQRIPTLQPGHYRGFARADPRNRQP